MTHSSSLNSKTNRRIPPLLRELTHSLKWARKIIQKVPMKITTQKILKSISVGLALTLFIKTVGMGAGDEVTIDKALAELKERGSFGEGAFIQNIQWIGKSSVPRIIDELDKNNSEVVSVLLKAMTSLRVPCSEGSGKVAEKLTDASWNVRYQAVSSFSLRNCTEHAYELSQALNSEKDESVLSALLESLGLLKYQQSIPILEKFQDDENLPLAIRLSASMSLLRLVGKSDLNLMRTALKQADEKIVLKAIQVYSLRDDKSLIDELIPYTKGNPRLSQSAKLAIKSIELNGIRNQPSREDALFTYINGDDPLLINWATKKIIHEYPSDKNIQKLKLIANRKISLASDSNPEMVVKPSQSEVLTILMKEGILTRNEVKEIINTQQSIEGALQ